MVARRWSIPFALACLLAATPGLAQEFEIREAVSGRTFAVDVVAGWALMAGGSGGRIDSIGSGPQVEGSFLYRPTSAPFRVGAGAGYGRLDLDETGGTVERLDLFVLGAWQFHTNESRMTPYAQFRAGWSRFSDDEGCGPDPDIAGCLTFLPGSRTRSGLAFGAVVGVEIPVSPRISLDVGGQFSWFNIGDYEFEGRTLPDTDATGSAFSLRGGAFLFFGP